MNMIERGRRFVQRLMEMAGRVLWQWRRCPHCGSTWTCKNGGYKRRPWSLLGGRQAIRIQRHLCHACGRTYAEERPGLVRGSWYKREVHRLAVDQWVHMRCSLRRTAEMVRSFVGHQERWQLWHVWEREGERREKCYLSASTVGRWLGSAGKVARKGIQGQWAGVENSGQFGCDGLWARLRGGAKRVVLVLTDTVTGVIMAIRVTDGEGKRKNWAGLFDRAREAGLPWSDIGGLVSDAAGGLYSFMRAKLSRVHHALCVWHVWRSLAKDIGKAVAGMAEEAQKQVRGELGRLLHAIMDASSYEAAEVALQTLSVHPQGERLAKKVNGQLDRLLYHLLPVHQGLVRIAPEWLWRDFRLRLSHGRNHGSEKRLEEAALVWMVYHNFTPAQWRSERKRKYKHPGLSPLRVAGAAPGKISYLDALEV